MDGGEQDALDGSDKGRGNAMPIDFNTDMIAEALALRLGDCSVFVPRLLTLDQAARYLGLTKEALKAKAHLGKVPIVELDKKLRFDRLDLDRIIEQSKKVA
jgi:excisionase family DNA binding protein